MNKPREAPIGVFDSGIGGLTVAREIMRQIPQERIVYFGDTARLPYGSKSRNTIIRYSRQIVRFLRTRQVKAIVVACNTASAYALDTLQQESDIPIIGVVKPGARMAAKASPGGNIGVIGTAGTVGSHIYRDYIQSLRPDAKVFEKACPLFVPLVEEGWRKDPVTEIVARRYLEEMIERKVDTLILGCTHYPLLMSKIVKYTPPGVRIIPQGEYVAASLTDYLRRHPEMEAACSQGGTCRYLTTENADKFRESAALFMHERVEVESIVL